MRINPQGRTLVIELLGHFNLELREFQASAKLWRKQKPRQLFALLANAPYHRLSRSDIYTALWPEHENPGNNLHVTIHHLRKMCDELPTPDIDIVLSTEQVTLHLPEETWIDVHVFETSARELLQSGGDPSIFRETIDLYGGPFLPDDEADLWTIPIREHLAQFYAQLVLKYADMMARHDPQAAITALHSLATHDPTHEGAIIRLMLLAQRQGQRSMVQSLYDQLVESLQLRLDLEPMAQTREIAEACLNNTLSLLPLNDWGLANYRQRLRTHLPFAPVKQPPLSRETQFNAILETVKNIPAGQGSIVGIYGSAGMGKLQLSHAVLTELYTQDWIIIAGRPFSGDKGSAYEPIIEALGEYLRWSPPLKLDELSEAAMQQLLGPAIPEDWRSKTVLPRLESQSLLFLGLLRLFESISQHGPVAFFIDDFHRADQDTIEFIVFLLRRIKTLRVLLLLTYREEEVDPGIPQLRYWQEGIRQGIISVFKLKPLDYVISKQLLLSLERPVPEELIESLIKRSGGNPFFLRELGLQASLRQDNAVTPVDIEQSPLPSAILDVVYTRLSSLSTAARAVIELGAVAMPYWTIQLTENVLKMAPSVTEKAIDELLNNRLIREQEQGFVIRQALIREVLYRQMTRNRRLRLHGLLADLLIEQSAPAGIIWQHLIESDSTTERAEKMIVYGLDAAQQAYEIAADDEVRRTYEHVHKLLAKYTGTPDQWLEVLFGLATISFRHGFYEHARELCEEAAQWTTDLPEVENERRNRLGWLSYRQSNLTEALEHFHAVRCLAQETSLLWAEALTGEALIHFVQGHLDVAQTLLEQALPYFDETQPSVFQARGLFLYSALAFDACDISRAEEYYRLSIIHAEQAGDILYSALLRTNSANMMIRRGELREALRLVEESLDVTKQLGNRDYESIQYTYLVWIYIGFGEFDKALVAYEQAMQRIREVDNTEIRADLMTMKATIGRYQKEWIIVGSILQKVIDILGDQPYYRSKADLFIELSYLKLFGPNPGIDIAEQYAQEALTQAHKSQLQDSIALALIVQSSVMRKKGDYIRAAENVYEAVALLKRMGANLHLVEAYLQLSRIAFDCQDFVLARTELEKAKALALRCEATAIYREIIDFGARLESQRDHSQESRETLDYNEDWLAPILTGEQSLAERAHDLGVSRAQLRRAYQRYQQTLDNLKDIAEQID